MQLTNEQRESLWASFAAWGERNGVDADGHKDDWLPWWQCFQAGYQSSALRESPAKAVTLPDGLAGLWQYIQAMIDSNVPHRTKGFRLGEATIQFALKHLADEHRELQEAADAPTAMSEETRNELADVLGVLIHLAILLKETPESFAKREIEKLKLRFEIPVPTPPAKGVEG